MDYNFFYKDEMPLDNWDYSVDLFIAAYNLAEHTKFAYQQISAKQKLWVIQQEYNLSPEDYPVEQCFICNSQGQSEYRETDFVREFLSSGVEDIIDEAKSICIDITGFLSPYLMMLVSWLAYKKIKQVDFIFSEPARYQEKGKTKFANSFFEIRPIGGYHGVQLSTGTEKEMLVIGAGYDNNLIAGVAEYKASAIKKIQILGFPSLKADMYQENILRIDRASNSIGHSYSEDNTDFFLTPANDPFATASTLHSLLTKYSEQFPDATWYLCPLATKAQALGFCLFYLTECYDKPISIIYPFSKNYSSLTGWGISRCWKYTIEFPNLSLT